MKVATAAYPLDWLDSWAQYEDKIAQWVATAAGEGAKLLVFPEYGAMELATLDGAEIAGDLEQSLWSVADKLEALAFSTGKGVERLPEPKIAKPDISEEL